ncbi:hypothetical protein D9M70_469900 [compost metagenome]
MVTRHHRLDDGGDAGRIETGAEHRRFHLGGRDRHPVGDRRRCLRSAKSHRQPVTRSRLYLHAHLTQGIEHARHRPPAERGIADEGRFEIIDADETHDEAATGAGVAEIERRFRRKQRTIADAVDDPGVALLADPGTYRLHGPAGGDHIRALEQAGDTRFAGGKPAQHQRPMRDRLVAGYSDRTLKAV